MSDNIYKQLAIMNILFPSSKGNLTVNQLYQLPLRSSRGLDLNTLAGEYDAESNADSKDYIGSKTKRSSVAELRFKVVMDVIEYKKNQRKAIQEEMKLKEHRAKIKEIIEKRKLKDLEELPLEELEKLL